MLNLHKPEVVIDILQIDVALPDLSKCQFNWTWNIYSKSNILKLIDTFVPWNQIFQYLVCNQYQHLCISVMYLLQSDSESNANISTLWNYSLRVAFLLIQMNMWDCNGIIHNRMRIIQQITGSLHKSLSRVIKTFPHRCIHNLHNSPESFHVKFDFL